MTYVVIVDNEVICVRTTLEEAFNAVEECSWKKWKGNKWDNVTVAEIDNGRLLMNYNVGKDGIFYEDLDYSEEYFDKWDIKYVYEKNQTSMADKEFENYIQQLKDIRASSKGD